ncbi:MAG: carboxypeptidase regulatory-like domain-containing protein [Planctomycetes bacterium]|nr:carboxypeptidase regulatory-like domain-containing protein [Planctomycetota bacterium]
MSHTHRAVLIGLAFAGLAVFVLAVASLGRVRPPHTPVRTRDARNPDHAAATQVLPRHPRALPAAESGSGSITGTVVAPTGEPAPGAQVAAFTFDGVARIAGRVTTDADGRFALPALASGLYTVTAERGGVGHAARHRVAVAPDAATSLGPIHLRAGARIDLLVLDRRMAPAQDLSVRVDSVYEGNDRGAYSVAFQETQTDASGRVSLDNVPDGLYNLQVARVETVEAQGRTVRLLRDAENRSFRVSEGALLAQFVWRPEPAPAGGARVDLAVEDDREVPKQDASVGIYLVRPNRDRYTYGLLVDAGRSDARGRMSTAPLADAPYCALVTAAGFGTALERFDVRGAKCSVSTPIRVKLVRT